MNDYFLNLIDNPTFSPSDFNSVGLNASNTTLLDKQDYLNSSLITLNPAFLTNGSFDQDKFDNAYKAAQVGLLGLHEILEDDDISAGLFQDNNILAPESLKIKTPQYEIIRMPNPFKEITGFGTYGKTEDPQLSLREEAEAHKIWDYDKGVWLDETPNDRPLKNFYNPLVLAAYDFDADINGNPTDNPDEIFYHKGDLKTDQFGEYYYETLGNRSVYNKKVLSGFDTLTTDGSVWNKIDFLDSDDMEKSTAGSFARAAALVIPAFIPYVGPVYLGIRVALGLSEILPAVGKALTSFTGISTPILDKIEAINDAFTFSTSDKTEGSAERGVESNLWTMETALNLAASVITQLGELRWLFTKSNALLSGVDSKVISGTAEEVLAARLAWITNYINKNKDAINKALDAKKTNLWDRVVTDQQLALMALEKQIKIGQKLGSQIALGYMTGITTASSYQEAKELGASDIEAAIYMLGYTAAEYGLLKTDLGKWIMPELKAQRLEHKAVGDLIANIRKETVDKTSDIGKSKYFKKIADLGKKIFTGDYSDSTLTSIGKMTLANAMAEGTEEVSEDVLKDAINGIFNAYAYLRGEKPKYEITAFTNPEMYVLDFLGGLMGGAVASHLPGMSNTRQFIKGLQEQRKVAESNADAGQQWAYGKIVEYVQNNEEQEFLKNMNKQTFASKTLSFDPLTDKDGKILTDDLGNILWKVDPENNQDSVIKNKITELVGNIKLTLEAQGGDISNDSLFNDVLLKPLIKPYRFLALRQSPIFRTYVTEFTALNTELVLLQLELLELEDLTDPNNRYIRDLRNLSPDKLDDVFKKWQQLVTEKQDEIKDKMKKLELWKNGTRGKEFILLALFSMSPIISGPYTGGLTYVQYAEEKAHKPWSKMSALERSTYQLEYYQSDISNRENIIRAYEIFNKNQKVFREALNNGILPDDFISQFETALAFTLSGINPKSPLFVEYLNSYFALPGQELNIDEDPTFDKSLFNKYSELILKEFGENTNFKDTLPKSISEYLTYNSEDQVYDEKLNDYLSLDILKALNNLNDTLKIELTAVLDLLSSVNQDALNRVKTKINDSSFGKATNEKVEEQKKLDLQDISTVFSALDQQVLNSYISDYKSVVGRKMANIGLDLILDKFKNKPMTSATKNSLIRYFLEIESTPFLNNTDPIISEGLKTMLLPNPIVALISSMYASLKTQNVYFKVTEEKLASLLENLIHTNASSEFNYGTNELDAIDLAKLLIDVARSHVTAAKSEFGAEDILGIQDTFGYNAIVNEINKSDLPLINVDLANNIILQLNTLEDRLEIYETLFKINTGNILSLHTKTVNKVYSKYLKGLKRFVVTLPDDWDGVAELKGIIETIDDIDSDKIDEEYHIKILLDKLKADKAVFEFFEKNKNKSSDEFATLFNGLNLLTIKDSVHGEDSVTDEEQSDIDLVMHLILLACVDQSKVYKAYMDSISPDYAPVIGQEEAIIRAISYMTNYLMYDKLIDAYNSLVKLQIDAERAKNPDERINNYIPETGYNYPTIILSKRLIFISGSPGSGKTSAVLSTITLILQKLDPDLLSNVAVSSNTKKHADDIINSLRLLNATAFVTHSDDKNDYMHKISTNYSLEFNPDGTMKCDPNSYEYLDLNDGAPSLKNVGINKNFSPKLVIIDEATALSQLDQIINERFLEEGNKFSINLGDFLQLGALGLYEVQDTIYINQSDSSQYVHTIKLSQSLRADNNLIQWSIDNFRANFLEIILNTLTAWSDTNASVNTYNTRYKEDATGLYGVKAVNKNNDKDWQQSIDNIINNLPENEKLNVISNDANSLVLQYLQSKYLDRFTFLTAGASLGGEGTYYIVDISTPSSIKFGDIEYLKGASGPDSRLLIIDTFEIITKSIYTGFSRAKRGALVITDSVTSKVLNSQQSSVTTQQMSLRAIEQFGQSRKKIIDKALPNDTKYPSISLGGITTPPPGNGDSDNGGSDDGGGDDGNGNNNETPDKFKPGGQKKGHLEMKLHTMMCNETGCLITDPAITDPMDPSAALTLGKHSNIRRDSLQGLAHLHALGRLLGYADLSETLSVLGDDKIKYLRLLNTLRNIAIYEPNIDDIKNKIASELGLLASEINVDFIYKAPKGDHLKVGNDSKFLKFFKDTKEWISSIFSDNKNNAIRLPRNNTISILVTAATDINDIDNTTGNVTKTLYKNGEEIFETPVCIFTTPFSLFLTLGYEEYKQLYEDIVKSETGKRTNDPNYVPRIMLNLILALNIIRDNKIYKVNSHNYGPNLATGINKKNCFAAVDQVLMCCMIYNTLYISNYDSVVYLTNRKVNNPITNKDEFWTPAGFGKLSGVTMVNTGYTRGTNNLLDDSYEYTGKRMDLNEYKKAMPWRAISNVFNVTEDIKDSNGDIIIRKGAPFVIVSDYTDNPSDKNMLNEFIKLLNDPNASLIYNRIYVTPPTMDFDTYINNIYDLVVNHDSSTLDMIGSSIMPLRILQKLLLNTDGKGDSSFLTLVKLQVSLDEKSKARLDALIKFVDKLSNLTTEEALLVLGYNYDQLASSPLHAKVPGFHFTFGANNSLSQLGPTKITIRTVLTRNLVKLLTLSGTEFLDTSIYTLGKSKLTDANLCIAPSLAKSDTNSIVYKKIEAFNDTLAIERNGISQWTGILEHLKLNNSLNDILVTIGSSTYNFNTILLDSNNGYMINGKPLLINSKIDTTTITTDVSVLYPYMMYVLHKLDLDFNPINFNLTKDNLTKYINGIPGKKGGQGNKTDPFEKEVLDLIPLYNKAVKPEIINKLRDAYEKDGWRPTDLTSILEKIKTLLTPRADGILYFLVKNNKGNKIKYKQYDKIKNGDIFEVSNEEYFIISDNNKLYVASPTELLLIALDEARERYKNDSTIITALDARFKAPPSGNNLKLAESITDLVKGYDPKKATKLLRNLIDLIFRDLLKRLNGALVLDAQNNAQLIDNWELTLINRISRIYNDDMDDESWEDTTNIAQAFHLLFNILGSDLIIDRGPLTSLIFETVGLEINPDADAKDVLMLFSNFTQLYANLYEFIKNNLSEIQPYCNPPF